MERDNKWLLWTMIAIVIIVIGVSWLLIDYYIPDYNVRGQFGDKFGSVNALFSGLAFAGLIYTIILQRKDLQLQKKDLELTRKVSEVTNVPVIASGGGGSLKDFENVFIEGKAHAALAASLFHYGELSIKEVKLYLREMGIAVRI